jgi:tRNA synthetases class I (E and Q), anti-codon binding domain
VLDCIIQVIRNLPEGHLEEVQALRYPMRLEDKETYTIPFTRVCYIEQTDFRETDAKDYYGLAPNKSVMLRYTLSSIGSALLSPVCTEAPLHARAPRTMRVVLNAWVLDVGTGASSRARNAGMRILSSMSATRRMPTVS